MVESRLEYRPMSGKKQWHLREQMQLELERSLDQGCSRRFEEESGIDGS